MAVSEEITYFDHNYSYLQNLLFVHARHNITADLHFKRFITGANVITIKIPLKLISNSN